jgi:hypothetical protein
MSEEKIALFNDWLKESVNRILCTINKRDQPAALKALQDLAREKFKEIE